MARKKRKELQNINAILGSDFHIREDQPVCRTDDFWDTQWKTLAYIKRLARRHRVPVFHGGDLFHKWKASPLLLSMAIEHLPSQFFTVYGQHELPNHSWELQHKSAVETLRRAGSLTVLDECHYGHEPVNGSFKIGNRQVLVWHKFVWDGKKLPWPGCDEATAQELLERYPQFDLILTGDHHQPFVASREGRLLVNPGSLTRQSSDENHQPRVYFYDAEENQVAPVYVDSEVNAVSREHIAQKERREERIQAFVSRFKDYWHEEVGIDPERQGVSFEEKLERFFRTTDVKQQVKEIVYKSIEFE